MEQRVLEFSARQLGLVTSLQCAELGLSQKVQQRRVAMGAWLRLHRGVFKIGVAAPTLEEIEQAALLAAGSDAVLSHHSAAKRLGLDVPTSRGVHITIPASRVVSHIKGAKVWRSRDLAADDVTARGPFRLTRVGRTVLDLACLLDASWLRAVVDSALRVRRSNLYWIRRAQEQSGSGHSGAARLRKLLAEYDEEGEVADSVLESLAMELGVLTGRKPTLHHRVQDGARFVAEVDLAWPELQLCVELDSWQHHGSRAAFARDRARDRALFALGWVVLRYTWHEVTYESHRIIQELNAAFVQRQLARGR